MKKREVNLPILPPGGKWITVCLLLLSCAAMSPSVLAQNGVDLPTGVPRDLNSELRTRTWSIYAQGGLSWATGVWYQNVDANASYHQSPALGGGIDYTISPWIRVGTEYLWSSYRREQNLSSIDFSIFPAKVYGNYKVSFHHAKIGAQLNLMEFWPRRQAQWLNIWAGTGFGYSFASGNEYGIYFSNTLTQNGITAPLTENSSILNDSEITITGNVRTTNRHEGYNAPFVPASIHVEADLNRRITLGLKGEVDKVFDRKGIAPKSLLSAMVTLRFNFVPSSTRVQRKYYEGILDNLADQEKCLRGELEAARKKAESEERDRMQAEEQNDILIQQFVDCEQSRKRETVVEQPLSHYVQFDHNSSRLCPSERERIREFARSVMGKKLSLLAEASSPGTEEYNQRLSERRLEQVVKALIDEGFIEDDIHPQIAIGEQNGKPSTEGRRVTITVE
ncbi:MAG: OmpA family protein [Bacteroidales bacterium]|nr:OmpA family protein [Bacteroidales bacterium]